jgi:HEAT repeat protein
MHQGGNMIVALVLLTLFALLAAIGAIYRVQDKQNMRLQFNVQDVTAPAAEKPQLQPDLDSAQQEVPSIVQEPELQPELDSAQTTDGPAIAETPQVQQNSELAQSSQATPEQLLVALPFAAQSEVEIPLAASLGVTDVLHPQIVESPHLDLDHSDIPQAAHHDSPSVIEEVTQLEGAGELLDRLAQQAEDPDASVRVTVAAALGEIASQEQKRGRAISLLNQLTQDADPIVRTQAATSLGSIPLDIA